MMLEHGGGRCVPVLNGRLSGSSSSLSSAGKAADKMRGTRAGRGLDSKTKNSKTTKSCSNLSSSSSSPASSVSGSAARRTDTGAGMSNLVKHLMGCLEVR